jgi:hypothetical protein
VKLDQYAKAIVAGLTAGLIMYFSLRTDGVTADEWQLIISAVLANAGITWAVPNAPRPGDPTSPGTPLAAESTTSATRTIAEHRAEVAP